MVPPLPATTVVPEELPLELDPLVLPDEAPLAEPLLDEVELPVEPLLAELELPVEPLLAELELPVAPELLPELPLGVPAAD
jgi:hypothetical protein